MTGGGAAGAHCRLPYVTLFQTTQHVGSIVQVHLNATQVSHAGETTENMSQHLNHPVSTPYRIQGGVQFYW